MTRRPSIALALAMAVAVPVGAAQSAVAQPSSTTKRHHGHQRLGQLLSAEPMNPALWPAGTAVAYRISYVSSDRAGRRKVVTGSVYVPSAAYTGPGAKHGRPVVSWAHETTGLADNCAPSVAGQPFRTQGVLGALLGKGYLVVSSDYEGLGTPGEHPFLIGESEAHGVIDIVRAVQQLKGADASREWLAAGHSQGGQAALFTAAIAGDYGQGLKLHGTFASAPITSWRLTIEQARPFEPELPGNPFLPLVLSGLDTVEPDLFDESHLFTPKGMELYQAARTNTCFPALAPQIRAGKGKDFYHLDSTASDKLVNALERYAEVPVGSFTHPVFIAQGTADTTVYPLATAQTAARLKAAGTDVTFRYYPGAAHGPVQEASLPDLLTWAEQRLG